MNQTPIIEEAAAAWFAMQRRGPMSLEERHNFDIWRADPMHQAALNRMHELWGETAALKDSGITIARRRTSRLLPLALTACLAIAVSGGAYWSYQKRFTPLQTGIGEQRSQELSDGSIVALNVVSRVHYDATQSARHVRLDEGEATFIVQKDETRPFIVTVGDYEVQALGTTFNVLKRDEFLNVGVKEGLVEVRHRYGLSKPVLLRIGQRLNIKTTDSRTSPQQDTVAPHIIDEWRQRILTYEDQPVSKVINDLNLFYVRPMEASSKLANTNVSIRLIVGDRNETLSRLSGILDADVKQTSSGDLLVPRSAAN